MGSGGERGFGVVIRKLRVNAFHLRVSTENSDSIAVRLALRSINAFTCSAALPGPVLSLTKRGRLRSPRQPRLASPARL